MVGKGKAGIVISYFYLLSCVSRHLGSKLH